MTASSPTAFYFFEFLKGAIPTVGTALVLLATFRRYRAAPTQPSRWLVVVSALWFLVTAIDRLVLSAPIQRYFIEGALDPSAMSQREISYFTVTFWLWTSEQIMILAFGVAFFFAFRLSHANTSNHAMQPTPTRRSPDASHD
jgi:hypothetical protein